MGKQGGFFCLFVCFSLNPEALGSAEGRRDGQDLVLHILPPLSRRSKACGPGSLFRPCQRGSEKLGPQIASGLFFWSCLLVIMRKYSKFLVKKSFLLFIITGPDELSWHWSTEWRLASGARSGARVGGGTPESSPQLCSMVIYINLKKSLNLLYVLSQCLFLGMK